MNDIKNNRAECAKCGAIEPDNHDETWWLCDCKPPIKNLDEVMAKLLNEQFDLGYRQGVKEARARQEKEGE